MVNQEYRNDLLKRLNKYNNGCINGSLLLNHLMYAENLVIFSPYSYELQLLLIEYDIKADVKYNATNSMVMIIHSKYDMDFVFCFN